MLRQVLLGTVLFGALLSEGCSDAANALAVGEGPELMCSIPTSQILNGGPGKDGIPALSDPATTTVGGPGTEYLLDEDRVIGLLVGQEVLAIPINVMWWHEIVNLELGGKDLAVTHCPLTGSSLAFDRGPQDGVEFGVSGLLFRNNLIMYDRTNPESLWPQMVRAARCGAKDGTDLVMFPVVEMTWKGWRTLHPETRVVTPDSDFGRNYSVYPYGDYDRIDNTELLFPQAGLDSRRLPKERVLGLPSGDGGVAYPFGELALLGSAGVITTGSQVVLWDGQHDAAMAFSRELDGQLLDFVSDRVTVVDAQTGSVWLVDGMAVAGPLAGRKLSAVPEAYVAYWFAWAVFQPNTTLWSAQ